MTTLCRAILSAAVVIVGAIGCSKSPRIDSADGSADAGAAAAHVILPESEVIRGASIYPLHANLTDQRGATISLDVHRGSAVIVAMFYSSCPYACPTLISHIKQAEAALPEDVRKKTRVLLISFDPENDTPEVIAGLPAKYKVDSNRWTFARASEGDVRAISAALGVKYRRDDGSFNHSSVITLLNGAGEIELRIGGLDDATADVVHGLTEIVNKLSPN